MKLVLHRYGPPYDAIQAMGMILLIMMIFFVPGQWFVMMSLVVIGVSAFAQSAGFKPCSSLPAH